MFDANDQLAAAVAEAKRYREQARSLQERIDGLMREKSEAVRSAKAWKAKYEKLQRHGYVRMSFPEPRDFQLKAHEALRAGRAAGHRAQVLMAATGSGKCLGRDTPVMMADGSIRMVQDVCQGDRLLGPDGLPRNVISGNWARGSLPDNAIEGRRICECEPHSVASEDPGCKGIDALRRHASSCARRCSERQCRETFKASNSTARHCLKGWRADAIRDSSVPTTRPSENSRPTLGAWLGDGTMGKTALSKPMYNMVAAWIEYRNAIGYKGH